MALFDGKLGRLVAKGSRPRRILLACALYVVCSGVYFAVAGPERLGQHTAFNHYALLADAWLHGRQDLQYPPSGYPSYTQGNDFAVFEGKTYVSFPPFPAVLMLPLVKLAGSPEEFRDGQFIVWLAGIGPALLFLVLEKLRRDGRSPRSERQNVVLTLLFAFGTVYFFTAVQGTVWFSAHVVAVALIGGYVLCALDAAHPLLAGSLLACAWLTRPPTLLMCVLFALEGLRVCCREGLPAEGTFAERAKETWRRLDVRALLVRYTLFSLPILCAAAVAAWMNYSRFKDPFVFGHEYLTVRWRERMHTWGLFAYHYAPKNLGVSLTILPELPAKGTFCFEHAEPSIFKALFGASEPCTPLRINLHGLALWFTTPLYFWLFRPKVKTWLGAALAIAALLPAAMDLMYQNSGWAQFGYRFSNDYAPLLFVLLAVGARPMRWLFAACAAWALAWNLFGAVTFERMQKFYYAEGSQAELYQRD